MPPLPPPPVTPPPPPPVALPPRVGPPPEERVFVPPGRPPLRVTDPIEPPDPSFVVERPPIPVRTEVPDRFLPPIPRTIPRGFPDPRDERFPFARQMYAEGGAVMEDDGIPPEIRDRQRAVTQMLANRASMLQAAQSQSMPPQQLPQQAMGSPMAPQMPVPVNAPVGMMPQGQPLMPQMQGPQGPVSFGIPQQPGMGPQPSPMQVGIMGAQQLRGGF
jgi:hypothetical protein